MNDYLLKKSASSSFFTSNLYAKKICGCELRLIQLESGFFLGMGSESELFRTTARSKPDKQTVYNSGLCKTTLAGCMVAHM